MSGLNLIWHMHSLIRACNAFLCQILRNESRIQTKWNVSFFDKKLCDAYYARIRTRMYALEHTLGALMKPLTGSYNEDTSAAIYS